MSDKIEILEKFWSWIGLQQDSQVAVFAFFVSLISLFVTYKTNKKTIAIATEDSNLKQKKLKLEVENKLHEAFNLMGADPQLEAIQDFTNFHNLNKAQRLVDDCLILEPDNSRVYLFRGFVRQGLKKYKYALQDYIEAIRLNPNSASAYNALALLNSELGHFKEAEKCIRTAIKLSPEDSVSFFNLGNILSKSEKLKEAEDAYIRAIELADFSVPYSLNYGLTLMRNDRFNEALDVFNNDEYDNRDNPKFYVAKGILLSLSRDEESAIEAFTEALKLDPNFQVAHKAIGDCFLRKKVYAKAREHLEIAVSLNQIEPASHYSLAVALLASHEDDKAISHLKIAIAQDPEREEYKDMLVQFRGLQDLT